MYDSHARRKLIIYKNFSLYGYEQLSIHLPTQCTRKTVLVLAFIVHCDAVSEQAREYMECINLFSRWIHYVDIYTAYNAQCKPMFAIRMVNWFNAAKTYACIFIGMTLFVVKQER